MARLFLLALLLLLNSETVFAQVAATADEAYQYLQSQRTRARAVGGRAEKPPTDSLQKAVRILQQALVYYRQPAVTALAKTSQSLYFRQSDLLFDLAVLQSRLGQLERAVATLQSLLTPEFAEVYAPWMLTHPALAAVRQHPLLKPTLDQTATLQNVFDSPALTTGYRPTLTAAEKAAGLSKLWSEAKYNFAYFDHLPGLDWDQLYLDYLPKVQATASTVTYYRVLQQFYAQLHDGHTDVWANDGPVADSVYGRPPITAQLASVKSLVQKLNETLPNGTATR